MQLSQSQSDRFEELGLAFLAKFLEVELRRHPGNLDALIELGQIYTQQGRHEEGLEVDLRLARELPDNATVHYNLGCSLALLGRRQEALDALEKAIGLGYDDARFMESDADLESLYHLERFSELLARIQSLSSRG